MSHIPTCNLISVGDLTGCVIQQNDRLSVLSTQTGHVHYVLNGDLAEVTAVHVNQIAAEVRMLQCVFGDNDSAVADHHLDFLFVTVGISCGKFVP